MGLVEDFLTGQDKSAREKENKKYLEGLQERVNRINELEAEIEDLDDDELVSRTQKFRQRLSSGEDMNGKLLEEAFAVVREAAWCVQKRRTVLPFCGLALVVSLYLVPFLTSCCRSVALSMQASARIATLRRAAHRRLNPP
jgi:hypothetical protein